MIGRDRTVRGATLVPGTVHAKLITLSEPLSFWGGFDAATGLVTDQRHPDVGQCLTEKIVRMTAARGSSSGSSVLAEAIRLGTAPAGFLVRERDAILLLAAQVALELYGRKCVIVQLDAMAYEAVGHAKKVDVHAEPGGAQLHLKF